MIRVWRDLSVSKKLYLVVGVMAILIASEIFTLLFAMDTLSAVRTFVGGESLWSKAQKRAVHSLSRYAGSGDEFYFRQYNSILKVQEGDHQARIELEKPVFDYDRVRANFVQGQIHPDDVKGLVKLIRRFYWVPSVARALDVWRQADLEMDRLRQVAERLHADVKASNRRAIIEDLNSIDRVDSDLTAMEVRFSEILGEGSRWLERLLMWVILCVAATVEGTGLFLTIQFSRHLKNSLVELSGIANAVGEGDLTRVARIRSHDELGQLAVALNKMTEELKESEGLREEADTANRAKTLFLAAASHEIRNPLGVILGLVDVLKDPNVKPENRAQYLATIERTGHTLKDIINDILDVSKVETGHLDLYEERLPLKEFTSELLAMFEVQAKRGGNRLKFTPWKNAPAEVSTDDTRLRQILVNLINNALKYTHDGLVEIGYGLDGEDLVFDVRDTGIGIEPEKKDTLFKAFSRNQDAGRAALEGTGLGLALSRNLARMMGGDLILKASTPGAGSTFRVWIRPSEIHTEASAIGQTKPASEPTDLQKLKGRRVLVVEDSADNQMLIQLFLDRAKLNVDFASNGREGVELSMSLRPELILMDMQMPVMDGYEATRRLRESGYRGPIIALTANAMKQDRERCLKVGCDDYLTKPIEPNELYRVISKQLPAASRA